MNAQQLTLLDLDGQWLDRKSAALLLNCHTDTIKRREIPWQDHAVPRKIRVQVDLLDRKFLYRPDIVAKYKPELKTRTAQKAVDDLAGSGAPRTLFAKSAHRGSAPRVTKLPHVHQS